jgi:hypothetical protein
MRKGKEKTDGRKVRGKKTTRKTRRKWVDIVRMDLGEIDWGGVDGNGLAVDMDRWRALVNAVMNLRAP